MAFLEQSECRATVELNDWVGKIFPLLMFVVGLSSLGALVGTPLVYYNMSSLGCTVRYRLQTWVPVSPERWLFLMPRNTQIQSSPVDLISDLNCMDGYFLWELTCRRGKADFSFKK